MAQAALATFGTVYFTVNFFVLSMVPYRLAADPTGIQPLHDLGFAMTFVPVPPFTFQYLLISLAVLQGGQAQHVPAVSRLRELRMEAPPGSGLPDPAGPLGAVGVERAAELLDPRCRVLGLVLFFVLFWVLERWLRRPGHPLGEP